MEKKIKTKIGIYLCLMFIKNYKIFYVNMFLKRNIQKVPIWLDHFLEPTRYTRRAGIDLHSFYYLDHTTSSACNLLPIRLIQLFGSFVYKGVRILPTCQCSPKNRSYHLDTFHSN